MNKHMAVKLNHATYRAVLNMLSANGDARSVADVADEAARDWLADMARTSPAAAVEAARGYQWKSLFLPDGTLLRAQYHGEFYYAQVRGDHIEYHGRQYSPRQFVMHLMGSVRNAWRELWILSPGDALWHLADTRRRILRRDFAAPANAMPAALPFPDERKDLRANRKIGAPEDDSAALFQIPWIKALYDVDGAFIGPVDAFVSEDYDDPMELAEWAVTRTADMPDTGVGIASDKLQLIDCAAAPDSAPAAAPPAPSIASVTASACAPATCSPAAQVSAVASPGATGPDSASAHRSPAPPAPTVATTVAMGPESASVNRLPAGRAAAAATPAAMEPGAPSATCSPASQASTAATAAGMGQAAASDRPPPGRRPSLSVAEAAMARSSANTAAIRAKRERSFLRRGDIVRDDQPDLAQAMRNGCGYGPHGAGRAGPRDRRMPAFEALAWNRR